MTEGGWVRKHSLEEMRHSSVFCGSKTKEAFVDALRMFLASSLAVTAMAAKNQRMQALFLDKKDKQRDNKLIRSACAAPGSPSAS